MTKVSPQRIIHESQSIIQQLEYLLQPSDIPPDLREAISFNDAELELLCLRLPTNVETLYDLPTTKE